MLNIVRSMSWPWCVQMCLCVVYGFSRGARGTSLMSR